MLLVVVPALRMFFLGSETGPEAADRGGSGGHLVPAE
jgi:hypothetical protein